LVRFPGNGAWKILGVIAGIVAGTVVAIGWMESRWEAQAAPLTAQVKDHEERLRTLEGMSDDIRAIRRAVERGR